MFTTRAIPNSLRSGAKHFCCKVKFCVYRTLIFQEKPHYPDGAFFVAVEQPKLQAKRLINN